MGKDRRFDGNEWYNKNLDKRTRMALEARNAEFEEQYCGATDGDLAVIVRPRAQEHGRSPQKTEVIGSKLICRRFGTWKRALLEAGCSEPSGPSAIAETDLYRMEYARQAELYRSERDAKRERKGDAVRARKERDAERRRKKAQADNESIY